MRNGREIRLDGRVVDLASRAVTDGRHTVRLTDIEARLLAYLAEHPGRVIGRDELLSEVWGLRRLVPTRCVDTAVRRLRTKIESDPRRPRHVVKVHGEGYRFDTAVAPVPVAGSETDIPIDAGSFVGREAELAQVARWLADGVRVITVTGPPGSGRSRLVREIGRRYGGRFRGAFTHPREGAMVVLDDAGPAEALDAMATPGTVLVAAAGGRFAMDGERVLRIGPLDPDAACALFRERAGVDDEAVPDLVRGLDCLPLAVVTAATRAASVAPRDLLARVGNPLALLGPAVHTRVRRALDQLDDALRDALTAFAVFRGTFTLDAADAILGAAAIAPLADLVERGLVERGGARYRVLGLVRAALPPPTPARLRAHLAAMLAFGRASGCSFRGPTPEIGIADTLDVLDDFELALDTALRFDRVDAVRVMMAVDGPMLVRGPRARHLAMHARVAERIADLPPLWRVRALCMRGEALRVAARFSDARVDLSEAVREARAVEDPVEQGFAWGYLATLEHTEQRYDLGERAYRTAVALLGRAGHDDEATYLGSLGQLLVNRGRSEEAEPVLRRVLELRMRTGHARAEAHARNELGLLLVEVGRYGEATATLERAIELWLRHGDRRGEGVARNTLGLALLDQGSHDEAFAMHEAAASAARAAGQLRTEAMALGYQGVVRLLQRRPREAEALLRACVDVHRRSEQPWLASVAMCWLGAIEATQARFVEAEASFAEARGAVADRSEHDAMFALLHGVLRLARARGGSELTARAEARALLRDTEAMQRTSVEVRHAARLVESLVDTRRSS